MMRTIFLALSLLSLPGSLAEHACEAEVGSACPEETGEGIGSCLQDPEQHEKPTTISTGCSDFIALNQACKEDIERFCEEAFFTDDTTPCLSEWTQPEDLSDKCRTVVKWAVPKDDEELEDDGEGDEDTSGMTEAEKRERDEWREKRKAARGDVKQMVKDEKEKAEKDAKKAESKKWKEENPEEWQADQDLKKEARKQKDEIKRRERMTQAALERQRKAASGEDDKPEEGAEKPKKERKKKVKKTTWLEVISLSGFVLFLAGGIYFAYTNSDKFAPGQKESKQSKKSKKNR